MLFSTCAESTCRKSFLKSTRRQIYCSDACRQCAYRRRKMNRSESPDIDGKEEHPPEGAHGAGD